MKIVGVFFYLVFLLLSGGALHGFAVKANNYELHEVELITDTAAQVIMGDLTDLQLTTRGVSRSSPECWVTSISTMSRWATQSGPAGIAASGRDYCASMTNQDQKRLALELTHCQLMEERRSFFKVDMQNKEQSTPRISGDDDDSEGRYHSMQQSCPIGSSSTPYNPSSCLPLMSDYAGTLYHQILLYTNDICHRLTDDLQIQRKEETALKLIQASSTLSEQVQLQSLLLENQSASIREQQAEAMQIMEANSARMREKFLESERIFREREEMATLALEEWTNKTVGGWRERILGQQRDLERMQEIISHANSQMQPLSTMESYIKTITSGFSTFKSIILFFLSMNIAWLLTALPSTQCARRYLFGITIAGFASEVSVIWFADSLLEFFGEEEEVLIELIRYLTWGLSGITLLFFFVASFFGTCPSRNPEMTLEDLIRVQMDLMAKNARETSRVVENGCERDYARQRLEERFVRLNRRPKYMVRRYRHQQRSSSRGGVAVVTPRKSEHITTSIISPRLSQVPNSGRSPTGRNANATSDDTSDSNYNSNSDSNSDSESSISSHDKPPPARQSSGKKRKFSELEPSNRDDAAFVAVQSSRRSLRVTNGEEDGSVSSFSSDSSESCDGKRRKGSRD